MKVIYTKNNSKRSKEFQLQTTIFEKNGKRYIKKKALCHDAIVHIRRMYKNYHRLSENIISANIQLAKIIEKDEHSITFEYIDGVSLEEKIYRAILNTPNEVDKVLTEYKELLSKSFKIKKFDESCITKDFRQKFGNQDYSKLIGVDIFSGISNIDMIFSNIIYSDKKIYIIDYEWVVDNCPLDYVEYRAIGNILHNYKHLVKNKPLFEKYHNYDQIYYKMSNYFFDEYVNAKSFEKIQHNFLKKRESIAEHIQQNEQVIQQTYRELQQKEQQLQHQAQQLKDKEQQLKDKEQQIQNLLELAESMRIKNRIKRLLNIGKS